MPGFKYTVISVILAIVAQTQLATAQEPVASVGIFVGAATGDTEADSEFALNFNYHWSESVRFGVEYSRELGGEQKGSQDTPIGPLNFEVGAIESLTLHSVFVYADSYATLQPYMGAGIGISRRKFELSGPGPIPGSVVSGSDEDDVTRYIAFGGIDYNASPTLSIGGEIRFAQMENVDTTSIGVSIRFKF